MENCKVCGKPMTLIPAGISRKTGKAYSAFLSCPDRCVQPKSNPIPGWDKPVHKPSPSETDMLIEINVKLDKVLEILNREMDGGFDPSL